ADLDADGLPNDLCSVDPRVDRTIVEPAPETGARYAPFFLDALTLPYDAATMAPMGCLPGDFNEDGRRDLVVYYWGRTPIVFLRLPSAAGAEGVGNAPLGRESFVAVEAAPPAERAERWYTNALTSADVDGDGHLDLIVGNYFADESRILDARAGGREHMHSSMSRGDNGGVDRLLLFAGGSGGPSPSVAFADVPGVFPDFVARGWTLALGAADMDGDLLPEIYFANDFGPDRLLYNLSTPGRPRFALLEGRKGFTTPTSKVLGHDSFKGMGVDFADLNGDGRPDIYVSNIAAEWALEESHFVWMSKGDAGEARSEMRRGVAPYADASEPLGLSRSSWGWDARFADFDNDGIPEALQATGFVHGETNRWPELHELAMGNDNLLSNPFNWLHLRPGDDLSGHYPTPFFVRADSGSPGGPGEPPGRYFDLSGEVGNGDVQVSRGIAIADVDGDGRLDYAVANQWQPSRFYRNRAQAPGRFLELDLALPAVGEAAPSGSPAIGARATVELPDGRRLVAQVDGGTGHSGKRDPQLHFGLGKRAPERLVVEIAWRDRAGKIANRRIVLPPGRHRLVLDSQASALSEIPPSRPTPAS
ncbi:MAG TPA: CRTAC1 family protein, partial [Thermoanaerobaculia bacterium]|nr:CRTAC1 family protein [Thermoanaerobaculia bacterium]